MEESMLEQIQQMITMANESLTRNIRQEMAAMESRLGERIEETKRHSGVLVKGMRHELQLVAEGLQMHIEQRHHQERTYLHQQFRETRALIQSSYRELNERFDRHEQNHHT